MPKASGKYFVHFAVSRGSAAGEAAVGVELLSDMVSAKESRELLEGVDFFCEGRGLCLELFSRRFSFLSSEGAAQTGRQIFLTQFFVAARCPFSKRRPKVQAF